MKNGLVLMSLKFYVTTGKMIDFNDLWKKEDLYEAVNINEDQLKGKVRFVNCGRWSTWENIIGNAVLPIQEVFYIKHHLINLTNQ